MLKNIFKVLAQFGHIDVRTDVFPTGDCCLVRSNGLSKMNFPEIEISDCPTHLKDVASNLILKIAQNCMNNPESLAENKTIGGHFVKNNQPVIEAFRFVNAFSETSTLRVVDLDDKEEGFPHRLVATHLCATAGASRRDQLRLLLISVEVWPMEKVASNAALGDYEFNPNNFWSWIDLGTALSQTGKIDDAVDQWKTAICMWPRGGKLYASRMIARGAKNGLASVAVDFWRSVTDDAIRNWCVELGVELPEVALGAQ